MTQPIPLAAGAEASAPRLDGQVAIVTGASSGIGRATAIGLASAGANVVVNYPPTENAQTEAEAVVHDITQAGGTATAMPADVSDENGVDEMVAETVSRFGALHIMVANAGIERQSPIQDMSLDDWRDVIDVNLTGAFLSARAATRIFLRQRVDPQISVAAGKIVFTGSVHEFIPWAFQANYAASKGGIMMLMKSLAQELAPKKIRVNSVAPGAIRTPINRESWDDPEEAENLLKLIPYGRIGDPDDIARAVIWLASDLADYVTGTSLVIDGGMSLYPSFRGAG